MILVCDVDMALELIFIIFLHLFQGGCTGMSAEKEGIHQVPGEPSGIT